MSGRAPAIVCSGLGLWLGACEMRDARGPLEPSPATARALALATRPLQIPKSAAPKASSGEAPRPERAPRPKAGAEIAIGQGQVRLGSATGSPHRNPAREADEALVTLTAFSIDALPFPNDPEQAPRGATTREEASALCAAQEKRLCSELEWERSCKGAHDALYPGAEPFDAAVCAKDPLACASHAGVFALGTLGREWTSSTAGAADWDRLRTSVVRGAAKEAAPALHRCAARDAAAPQSRSESLLFRCCRGAAQSSEYPVQLDPEPFHALELKAEAASAVLESMPETRALAAGFRLPPASALGEALKVAGRSAQSISPWQSAPSAFRWSPVRGEEIVLLSGDTPQGALVVAYYPLPDGHARFAGSYTTKDEHTPILLAYKTDQREELLFTTCWGCDGEGGALRLDPETRLRFVLR